MLEIHEMMTNLTELLVDLSAKAIKAPEMKSEKGTEYLEHIKEMLLAAAEAEACFIRIVSESSVL